MKRNVIALDFDGVICDSAAECVVSAYGAYVHAKGEKFDPMESAAPDYFREGFYRIRPLIRDGRDYVMILYLLDLGVPIEDQEDFDHALETRLPDLLDIFGVEDGPGLEAAFQRYRAGFRGRDEMGWMDRNPLYSGMLHALRQRDGDLSRVFVTTSKPSHVAKGILEHNGFMLPEGHALGKDMVGTSPDKNVHMRLVTEASGAGYEDIHFVDDQVAHLESAMGLGVNCYLASYGYTTEKQVDKARGLGIRVLEEGELAGWMDGLLGEAWTPSCQSQ